MLAYGAPGARPGAVYRRAGHPATGHAAAAGQRRVRDQATFERRGGLVVFLTRFMLTPLALPTNLIAGSSRYSYARFLALDALGELIWICVYVGLGYTFAGQWETISELAGSLSGALVGLVTLVVAAGITYRASEPPWRGGRRSERWIIAAGWVAGCSRAGGIARSAVELAA
ncbi:MAG: VTT domain-containing protein [Kouleothrix sp.]|nr:VTT domain-containing protein [Kouleothrix sp.]